jgi:polar amino acid transport system substrate-binding protein
MRQSSLIGRLVGAVLAAVIVAATPAAKTAETATTDAFNVPLFRQVVPDAPKPDLRNLGPVRFLANGDFAPFSYLDASGALAGFSVELADAVCRELRLACEFAVRPWGEIAEAMGRGEGDAVIAGIKMTPENAENLDFTRPYYRPMARFAVHAQFKLKEPYTRALAGKRIGVMAGSAHEAWLKEMFAHSNIRPFTTQSEALEALRTGAVDALFDDAARLMFWLAGPGARGCCRLVEGAYVDENRFSPAMTIAVKRGNQQLLEALDYGLDRLQENGVYAAIFRRHFPMSPW